MKFQKQYTVLCGLLSCKNKEQNKHKSSYWSRKTKNFYTDKQTGVTGLSAIGKYSRNRVLSRIYHYLFQRLIFSFSNKIFSSPWYKLSKQCAEQQNRSVDMDILRHVFTFDLLDRYIFKKQKINNVCVIGDGQSNFVSPATVGIPIQFPYPPIPETTPFNKLFVFGCEGEPKCIEFNKAIGLAPIVKTSLNIPPTPVAAP